jgi:hypothetical protein
MADTERDTRGDTVSPSCIPLLVSENTRQINYLAGSLFCVYNPDLPSGPPLGLPSFHLRPDSFFSGSVFSLRSRLTIMLFSQMDVVASLGALLRWSRLFVAVHLVPVHREAAKGEARTSLVALSPMGDEEQGSSLKRNRLEICLQQFRSLTIGTF